MSATRSEQNISGEPTTTTARRRLPARLPALLRVLMRRAALAALCVTVLAAGPFGWTHLAAWRYVYDESGLPAADAPHPDVVLVLGAEVAPNGIEPKPFLRGRLDTAAALLDRGAARVILVSGDAHGGSGDETGVMTRYLGANLGVDPARLVADPYGLDTYDSCVRARQVYGVSRAWVVTQRYHLSRAVALCRRAGLDAYGVQARCDGCGLNLLRNAVRDYLACTKAALDTVSGRWPAIVSPPSRAVAEALERSD